MSESAPEILELLKSIDSGRPTRLHHGYGLKLKLSQQFHSDESGYGKIVFDRISGEFESEIVEGKLDFQHAITLSTFMNIDSYIYFTGTGENFYELVKEFMVGTCGYEEPKKVYDNGECVLCMDDSEELRIIIPCGHRCLCPSCADDASIRKCPICRSQTTKYLKQVNKSQFSLVEKGDLMTNEQEFSFDKGTEFPTNYDYETDSEEEIYQTDY